MNPDPAIERAEALLEHLDRLYSFAQLVTPDADAAARLVRATYARAFSIPEDERPDEEARTWLFRLLLEIRRERRAPYTPTHIEPTHHDAHELPDDLEASRLRHAEAILERLLPSALLSLPTRSRLLLVLCDVEGLSCADAGDVLETDAALACARLSEARTTLLERVREAATPHEETFIEQYITPDRLRAAIERTLQAELSPVPPTLSPQIPLPVTLPAHEAPRSHFAGGFTGPWVRALLIGSLLISIGFAGFALTRKAPEAQETNLIVLSAQNAPSVQPLLRTNDPVQASSFVKDHVGWIVNTPAFEGMVLEGVGISEVTPGVSVPVFTYTDTAGTRLAVYGYTYSLLDRAGDRLTLETDVLFELEDDTHYDLHDLGDAQAVLWRDRDDLLVAVTQGSAEDVQRRVVR